MTDRGFTIIEELLFAQANPNAINANGDTPLIACISSHANENWTYHTIELLVAANACVDPFKKTSISPDDPTTTVIVATGSPLIKAVNQKNFNIVKLLLGTYDVDVNEAIRGGHTPLMAAAAGGDCEIVQLLLENRATSGHDNFGNTAWHVAARNDKWRVIETLIKFSHGNLHNSQAANKMGQTPLHVAVIADSNMAANTLVTDAKACLWLIPGKPSPLHCAMENECSQLTLNALFKCEGGVAAHLNLSVQGLTPLFIAIRKNFGRGIAMLVRAGVDVNRAPLTAADDNSLMLPPLLEAARLHRCNIVKQLLDAGADTSVSCKRSGDGILHFLVDTYESSCVDTTAMICKKYGPDVINHMNAKGDTPLFEATHHGCAESTEVLLLAGALVNHRNKDCMTALHAAVCSEGVFASNVVKLMLENGADIEGRCGFVPPASSVVSLAVALAAANATVTVALANAPATTAAAAAARNAYDPCCTNNTDLQRTPLHFAVSYSNGKGRKWTVDLLISRKASVHITDAQGSTALHLAAMHGFSDVLSMLVVNGADANNRRLLDGATPLHLGAAVKKEGDDVIRTLIRLNADVTAQDNNGRTPLHYAVVEDPKAYHIELLLENKACVSVKDNQGLTALDLAELALEREHTNDVHMRARMTRAVAQLRQVEVLMAAAPPGAFKCGCGQPGCVAAVAAAAAAAAAAAMVVVVAAASPVKAAADPPAATSIVISDDDAESAAEAGSAARPKRAAADGGGEQQPRRRRSYKRAALSALLFSPP